MDYGKRKILTFCLVAVMMTLTFLGGCASSSPVQPTPTPEPTVEPTPTPEPTPDLSLHTEAGVWTKEFWDPETIECMEYMLCVPENAMQNMPLVVFLHGDGNVGDVGSLYWISIMEKTYEVYGEEFPYILLMPSTAEYSWEDNGIPERLMKLIDKIEEEYMTNPDKLIITGHSRGAIGVWYLINRWPERFSCAVPVSCGNDREFYHDRVKDVPVWAFVGGEYNDYGNYYSEMQGLVNGINYWGGTAELTVLEGCDHGTAPLAAFCKETFEWMLAQ